ncbi:DUF192 domain-containing protein [Neorhodopirellula pilleata]|uniref:ACR n=1 Tax=Neorhodopirellula pilleata TaxID=2714738 RepID=A0A5C6A2F8_9BACT|nr:DUF192 domain-containing protein [Neorhodopirellula pilleata]TWT93520.1 hypothetical protein Pla100_40380 [Neorhodopirellula pilleata]
MRFPMLGRWEDAETGAVLLERLFVAETFWQRFRGLQFAKPLEDNCGLLLRNCRSVHTMWMRFAIDLIFLSEDLQILETRLGVNPWRMVIPKTKGVAHVIEVTAGQKGNLQEGTKTRIIQDTGSPRPVSGRGAGGEVLS